METQQQKLDILILEDNMNLSSEQLQKHAQLAALDEAKVYGWESVEVRMSNIKPEQNGEFLRYTFDVYGVPSENLEVHPEQQLASKSSPKPKAAAAPDVGV